MFEIQTGEGGYLKLSGRLDAAESERALTQLNTLSQPITVDCSDLEYISSAGLGILLQTYKRLLGLGHTFKLVNMQPRVRNVFTYAGLDKFLLIE
ncbi:MAG: hypothetical protein A2W00_06150 [Candidatus Eisenbacteria bacterium RBG_16_71_46]|nr:MAG: hypothetical protein A2W00_06150 [Candidatus Eisenbacteria bacterium RBG_16_71_46]OGF24860.1 MAG: hypothetical protein A2V63_04155 [Candidatus Eisenbacteria bacterium RBG_19FT_COMBO_70_11]